MHDENYGYGHLNPSEIFSKKKKELENLFNKDILDKINYLFSYYL